MAAVVLTRQIQHKQADVCFQKQVNFGNTMNAIMNCNECRNEFQTVLEGSMHLVSMFKQGGRQVLIVG
jgi:hypothetical protein